MLETQPMIPVLERQPIGVEQKISPRRQAEEIDSVVKEMENCFEGKMNQARFDELLKKFESVDTLEDWSASQKHLAKMIFGIARMFKNEGIRERLDKDLQLARISIEQMRSNGTKQAEIAQKESELNSISKRIFDCNLVSASWQNEMLETLFVFTDRRQQDRIWRLYGNGWNSFLQDKMGEQFRHSVLMVAATIKALRALAPELKTTSYSATENDDARYGIDFFAAPELNPIDPTVHLAVQIKSSAQRRVVLIPSYWGRNQVRQNFPLVRVGSDNDQKHMKQMSEWPERMRGWQEDYFRTNGEQIPLVGLWVEYPAAEVADMLSGKPQPEFIAALRQALSQMDKPLTESYGYDRD